MITLIFFFDPQQLLSMKIFNILWKGQETPNPLFMATKLFQTKKKKINIFGEN